MTVFLVYSHNFIDFDAQEEPNKYSVSYMPFETRLESIFTTFIKVPLHSHRSAFYDSLYNPLIQDDEDIEYLSMRTNEVAETYVPSPPDIKSLSIINLDIAIFLSG